MVNAVVSLQDLRRGQKAEVLQMSGHRDHVHRLEEMGLSGGTMVEVFRAGNPCILRMHNNKLCLRADDNLRIMVRPHTADEQVAK